MSQQLHNFKGKKIVITGGLGFIGSSLAIRLCEAGAKVVIYDLKDARFGANPYNIEPIKSDVDIVYGDVREGEKLAKCLDGADVVYPLAGQVSHLGSMKDPVLDMQVNVLGHLNVLEACKNSEVKIVFTSTRQVYGKLKYLPVDEKHPIQPPDVNAISKVSAEQLCILYQQVYGLSSCVLRLTNVYGPRMDIRADDKGFISVFTRKALNGEAIEIFGDGMQRRDLNYIDDVVDALVLSASHEQCNGQVFNLGHFEPLNLVQIIETLRDHCEFEFKKIPFPAERKKIDIGDYFSDYSEFSKATGWMPRVSFAVGLEKTVSYFRGNLARYL